MAGHNFVVVIVVFLELIIWVCFCFEFGYMGVFLLCDSWLEEFDWCFDSQNEF